ncbi:interleukin-6 receptor subunit beta [Pelodytes ibericus]
MIDQYIHSIPIPKLSTKQLEDLNKPLSKTEIKDAIHRLKQRKAPGPDGIKNSFFKLLEDSLIDPLTKTFNDFIKQKHIPDEILKANITPIPKPGKDHEDVQNYRPISLLNADIKIYSSIIAERLKIVIPTLIHRDQTGFLPERLASNNIRKVIDVLEMAQREETPTLILSLDAEKAFDRVGWKYLKGCLKAFGLSGQILDAFMLLYSNPKARTVGNGIMSEWFRINNGTRQGCPLSPLLYILSIEPLAIKIREESRINGYVCKDVELKLNMFADDILVTLGKPTESLEALMTTLEEFGRISNYKLNLTKTVALPIAVGKGELKKIQEKYTFRWTDDSLEYLGIIITADPKNIMEANILPVLKDMNSTLKKVKNSAKGKMLLFYSLVLLTYLVYAGQLKHCANIIPEAPVLELYSKFTAYCIINESCTVQDAGQLFWRLQKTKIPESQYTVLNKTVSSVTIVPTFTTDQLLTCSFLAFDDIETTLYGIILTAGYPPDKPDNLTCIAYNAEKLTCSWNPGKYTHLTTNYILKSKWPAASEIQNCLPQGVNNSCTISPPDFQLYIDTIFWVEAKNALGTVTSERLVKDVANLVKPDPPEIQSLIVSVHLPKAIKIEWKNPMEKNPNMKMKYIIRYRKTSSDEWEQVPPNDTASHRTSFTLQELHPYTEYVVSLRCMQSNGQGFWSDWSKEKRTVTPENTPGKGLDIWRRLGNADEFGNRSLVLMWKELDPVFANGKILTYTVNLYRRRAELFHTAVVTDMSYEMVIPEDPFIVMIRAHNSVGDSPWSSMVIPSAKHARAQNANIEVKAFPKDGKLWVEWTPDNKSTEGYIIEWCINSQIHSCDTEWQREQNSTRGAFLRGDIQPFKWYFIKVFPTYKDGHESYRSVEAYLQQGAPSVGPAIRTKKVEKSKAVLVWEPIPLDSRNGFLKYYTLTYAPSHGNKTTVKINSSDTEYTLTQLSGDMLYTVHMTAYTESGQKDGPVFTFTTLRFDNGEVEAIVVISCIVFLILTLIGASVCFSKRDLIKKHIWPNVPDPSKSNIAQWSHQTPTRHELNPNRMFQDGNFTDVSVVEVSEEKKTYNEQDKKPMDLLKKNTSYGLSSGIGGSSGLSSPQTSITDNDEVESAQTTSSTVQYSTVIIGGYRDQQPTAVAPHVFARSESTQPLLESEERPDEQQVPESDNVVVSNHYFKQNCSPVDGTGRLQTSSPEDLTNKPPDGAGPQNCLQDVSLGQNGSSEEQSVNPQVNHEIKSYLPQTTGRGGYMPQ